jgi:tetratricopeptide (TPR) repeat protein
MNKKRLDSRSAAAIFFAILGSFLWGAVTGAVDGAVKDKASGQVLEGVKVTIVFSKNQAMAYELQTDKKGHFYKGGLVPGSYNLTFEKDGYIPQSGYVRVFLEQTTPVEAHLETAKGPTAAGVTWTKAAGQASELISAGRYDKAIAGLGEAITQDPAQAVLFYYRGFALEKLGQGDRALEDYRKAAELKPDFVLPLSRSGVILAKKGDFEKAAGFYERAVELGDRNPETYYNSGVCLINLGRKEEARVAFEKLLTLDPGYADGYYQLGLIFLGNGETAKAKDYLQKFIGLDPENTNAALAKEILKSLN